MRTRLGIAISGAALMASLAGCGDDGPDDAVRSGERPQVTVTLRDGSMDIPARIPGGLVDVTLRAEEGEVQHHVAFFRLEPGVSYEEFLDPPDGDDTGMMTFRGGNGTLLPGRTQRLTLDLEPGRYAVRDLGEQDNASAEVIVEGAESRQEPTADGTITLGPGMSMDVPDDFELDGTWRFANRDPEEPHEATLLRLEPGATVEDLVAWAKSFDGPPPAEFDGGFGAIGPSVDGWLHFDGEPTAGTYVLACFIPGEDGTPHIAQGMLAEVPT